MADGPFLRPGEALRDLRTLEALEEKPDISQRDLASRLGIAVGLTNACLRKMARKGLIKVKRINSRNITYHLTGAGIAEKARLSLEFTEATIDFYRRAKETVNTTLAQLQALGATRIVVLGANDLAEIVGICSGAYGIEIVAIADATPDAVERPAILGLRAVPVTEIPTDGFDALVVTDTATYKESPSEAKKLASGRLVAWPIEGRVESSREGPK